MLIVGSDRCCRNVRHTQHVRAVGTCHTHVHTLFWLFWLWLCYCALSCQLCCQQVQGAAWSRQPHVYVSRWVSLACRHKWSSHSTVLLVALRACCDLPYLGCVRSSLSVVAKTSTLSPLRCRTVSAFLFLLSYPLSSPACVPMLLLLPQVLTYTCATGAVCSEWPSAVGCSATRGWSCWKA